MPLKPEQSPYSNDALSALEAGKKTIQDSLQANMDVFGGKLKAEERKTIQDAVMRTVDDKIANYAQNYIPKQTRRGEVLYVQHIDDFMPYVRLDMLRELMKQMNDRHVDGLTDLDNQIKVLEAEIAVTKTQLGRAKEAFGRTNKEVQGGFSELVTGKEYKELLDKTEAMGKTEGEISAYQDTLTQIATIPNLSSAKQKLTQTEKNIRKIAGEMDTANTSVESAIKDLNTLFSGNAIQVFQDSIDKVIIPGLQNIQSGNIKTMGEANQVVGSLTTVETGINGQIGQLNGTITGIDTSVAALIIVRDNPSSDPSLATEMQDQITQLEKIKATLTANITTLNGQLSSVSTARTQLDTAVKSSTTITELTQKQHELTQASTSLLTTLGQWQQAHTDGMSHLTTAHDILIKHGGIKKRLNRQADTLNSVIGEIDKQGMTIDTVKKYLKQKLQNSQNNLGIEISEKEEAENNYQGKIDALQGKVKILRDRARNLGKKEGTLSTLQEQKKKADEQKGERNTGVEDATKGATRVETVREGIDANTRIRINAQNLIVRSGPTKNAKPVLDPSDTKKALMLQTGMSVKPVIEDGSVVMYRDETQKDGIREYIQIQLNNGEKGWIALSDKLSNGKIKQEYGNIILSEEKTDVAKSYELKGDNIRLRTGYSTTADSLDVLDNKKVSDIHLVLNLDSGDNRPEGSGLRWRQVDVTYKDGTTKRGYIAEKFLTERTTPVVISPKKQSNESSVAAPKENTVPAGEWVPNRPGIMYSPYAGKLQLVDVTGLPAGKEVKCPYSGKLIKIPPFPTK